MSNQNCVCHMDQIAPPGTLVITRTKIDPYLMDFINKSWTKQMKKSIRKKYFKKWTENGKKHSKCLCMILNPEKNNVECGETYSSPSSSTELEHLTCHPHIPEFKDLKGQLQQTMEGYLGKPENVPSFETSSLMFLLSHNISWNAYNSVWWNVLVTKYLCRSAFQEDAAKAHMTKGNRAISGKIMQIIARVPYYSISEDEGTVLGKTKVLHNIHMFDPVDWKYKTFLLRYFETTSKHSEVLVAHWNTTMTQWKINHKNIAAFVSDMALDYVPNDMGLVHGPCSTHCLDLCLEDNYQVAIRDEVDKFKKIREFLTGTSVVENQYSRSQEKHVEVSKSFPITAMVRFVTHEQVFDHIKVYWKACNETVEIHKNTDLIIKESEVETSRGCMIVFEHVRSTMKELQCSMCCKYLPLLYGLINSLEKLKTFYPKIFVARTGQELLRTGVIQSIKDRVGGGETNKQLSNATRRFYVKAMLMEPFIKGKIDVKNQGGISRVFPLWIKNTLIEALKKELSKELETLIRQNTKDLDDKELSSDEEEDEPPKKKKKK